MSVTDLSVQELAQALTAGELSAQELVRAYLDQLEADDLGAFVTVIGEEALARAREVDEGRKLGELASPLAGIPMSLQDNLCTAGVATTCSSKMLEGFIPPYSATVYERLLAAGCILLGKNNMNEFSLGGGSQPGLGKETANPWDRDRVSGPCGCAAAVAGGRTAFALGSDTGGSLRQAAAFCGVVGLKPTYGRISRHGLISFAPSLEQVGCVTRTVGDAAQVLGAIAGEDLQDSTTTKAQSLSERELGNGVQGLKVGLPREFLREDGLDPQVKGRVKEAAEALEGLGAVVEETSLPHLAYASPVYQVIAAAEASSDLANFDGVRFGFRGQGKDLQDMYRKSRSESLGPGVKRWLIMGTLVLSEDYFDDFFSQAQRVRTLIIRDLEGALSKYDLLLGPVTPTVPYPLSGKGGENPLQLSLEDRYTCPANLAGLPALSLPWRQVEGVPVGIQLLGRAFEEEALLQAAKALEEVR